MAELSRQEIVCREYKAVPHTADQIVSDPQLAVEFCERVNACLPDAVGKFEVGALNKFLLNLRRRGEENGGLIRKKRPR